MQRDSSDSQWVSAYHRKAIDRVSCLKGKSITTQGPSIFAYEFNREANTTKPTMCGADGSHHDYFELFRLSDDLYTSTLFTSRDSQYRRYPNLRNMMAFIVGVSIDAITPAGEMVANSENSTGYLFSTPQDEDRILSSGKSAEQKLVCVYFDRDRIEKSLGMSHREFPKALQDFYQRSEDTCELLPVTMPYSATVIARDLLASPMSGALRYRQVNRPGFSGDLFS